MKIPMAALALLVVCFSLGAAQSADSPVGLTLTQKEFVWLEPMIATVRVAGEKPVALPAGPEEGRLRFVIEPEVKRRTDAKPLYVESRAAHLQVNLRRYDLFEWFSFPQKGGTWTVKAVVTHDGSEVTSQPIRFSMAPVAKGHDDYLAMRRLHHPPWSNYEVNKFCGDTFDLVKQWPTSRLAKYSHYWSGRYSQNKGEYEAAIGSYRIVIEKYPDFVLVDYAGYGIVECLAAQNKHKEALEEIGRLLKLCSRCARKAGGGCATDSTVRVLAYDLDMRLRKKVD